MRSARFLFLLWVALALPGLGFANVITTERTEASLVSESKAVRAGERFWVMLHIRMQPGWHTYWKNPGDSGTPPILTWTVPNGYTTGETRFLAPERLKMGPLVDYGYSNDAYFPVAITPPSIVRPNTTAIFMVHAQWLVCKEICVPETANLSLALPGSGASAMEPSADAAFVQSAVNKLPSRLAQSLQFYTAGGEVHFELSEKDIPYSYAKSAQFFPSTDGFITNAADQKIRIMSDRVSLVLSQAQTKIPDSAFGVVSLFAENGARRDYEVHLQASSMPAMAPSENTALPLMMFFAFLGGIILNLMPCVFPILSLKCLAVAKKSASRSEETRTQGLAYAAGVIVSFLVLAFVLIFAHRGGQVVGWGYQMQSPVFVSLLAVVLFVVGLNLSGYFELPVLFGNVGGKHTHKDNLLGSFITGILAVLVATPCTAPFMATAIGFALTQGTITILAVFISLGFGLAAPFLLISFSPHLIRLLPKPGGWMNTFKQFLAFPMYLAAAWLLWVLAREIGPDGAGIALIAMVLVTFAIWLSQHGMRLGAWLLGALAIAFMIFMFHMAASAKPMHRSDSEPFSQSRLEALRRDGRAVFVDATADWCITCKVNEAVALSKPQVTQAFADKHIAFMTADWTHEDGEITHYLESFGRSGVPLYVYYPPQNGAPILLPQILTPSKVLEVIK